MHVTVCVTLDHHNSICSNIERQYCTISITFFSFLRQNNFLDFASHSRVIEDQQKRLFMSAHLEIYSIFVDDFELFFVSSSFFSSFHFFLSSLQLCNVSCIQREIYFIFAIDNFFFTQNAPLSSWNWKIREEILVTDFSS